MSSAIPTNPVRDVKTIRLKAAPKGASALTANRMRALLTNMHASVFAKHDLADPLTLLATTGLRRSEPLALQ